MQLEKEEENMKKVKKVEGELEYFLDEGQWAEGELTFDSFIQKLLEYLERVSGEDGEQLKGLLNKIKFITLTMVQHSQNLQALLEDQTDELSYFKKYEFMYEKERNQKMHLYLKY